MVSVKSKPKSRINQALRDIFKPDVPEFIGNFEIDEGSCNDWIATNKFIETAYASPAQPMMIYCIAPTELAEIEVDYASTAQPMAICSTAHKELAEEEVTEVRDISISQIKKEMLSLLSDGKTRYIDEIAEELNLDFIDVMEAFNQLQEEEKLFIDENKL